MKPEGAMHARPHKTQKSNGHRHFSRKNPKSECEWDPTDAMRVAFTKLLPKSKPDLAATADLRYTLQEIADCIGQIPFSGSRDKGFRCIIETCTLYPKPSNVLGQFRDSLCVVRRVAEKDGAGRSYPVAPGREEEAGDFMRRVRSFTSLSGLEGMRKRALADARNGFSTYQIEFVRWNEVERISELNVGITWGM